MVLLALAFSIVLGLAVVFLNNAFISRSGQYSTVALYAADAGTEEALYKERQGGSLDSCANTNIACEGPTHVDPSDINSATYTFYVTDDTANPPIRHIKSVGRYKGTNRAIEIFYPKP